MVPIDISQTPARETAPDSTAETVGLAVRHSDGCLHAEIYIRDGAESMLTVYTITGKMRFKKRILSSGYHKLLINLRRGVYVASLVSGKFWTAKRVTIN